ncbi:MAG: XRE family transcriptional regulator [Betaproteobacteria bacterium]|nr:XRE family transcriptional regulator [Betaproteobacteria bacterium]
MLSFISPEEAMYQLAERVKQSRLAENFSRKSLSERSGVSEASIKRFETTGEIALLSLLKLSYALGSMQDFDKVFAPKDVISIKDITKKQRARGRS